MTRREFITAIVAVAWTARPLTAQTPRRVRIGYLSGGSPETRETTIEVLIAALRDFGWRIGETLEIDEGWANGEFSRIPTLADELVARRPDLLVATGSTEAASLKAATATIPIIFLQVADPIASGVVESIRHPGRNITGFAQGPQILWGKRIDVLTELLGRPPRHLAWLGNPGNAGTDASWADAKEAAAKSAADLIRIEVSTAGELDSVFDRIRDRDALLVQWDFLFSTVRYRIAALAAAQRLPAIYENRLQVLAGGLMSYGADLRDNYRQGASYVHRILNGANPGDLPVNQASRFELVINLKTAKALGLSIPAAVLARADEVIE
jgi:putative ABC transport system substrate-binding protein